MAATGKATSETRPAIRDAVWAASCTALATLLTVGNGGIGATVGGADLFGYFVPKYQAVTHALFVEHRLPLWNPYEFTGIPLLGTHQATTFYPLTWISFGPFSAHVGLQVFYALHVFVLSWGLIAYLRRHDVARPFTAMAVLVAVAGETTGHARVGIDHPSFLGSLAWFPAILLFWERSVESTRPWLGWMAVAVAAQWLAGYPDFSLTTPVVLGAIALLGCSDAAIAAGPRRRLGMLVAGVALGGVLAAIQLVPTAEAVASSARGLIGVDLSFFRWGFLPRRWIDLWHWTVGRVGVATFALAAMPFLRPTRARFAWGLALAVTLLAGWRPVRWLYLLPVFSSIRFPFSWDLIGGVLWAILAAIGAAQGWRSASRAMRGVTLALTLWASGHAAYVVWGAPVAFHHPRPNEEDLDRRARSLGDLLRWMPGAMRIVSAKETATGAALRHHLPFANGNEPAMPPSRVADLFEAFYPGGGGVAGNLPVDRNPDLAALLGVGVVVVHRVRVPLMLKAGFHQIGRILPDEYIFYQRPMPRARLVHRARIAKSPREALDMTVASARGLRRMAVLEAPVPAEVVLRAPTGPEGVEIVESAPERVVIEATLSQPGLLVLTDTYAAGWTATVDGVPTPILQADYAFRAVPLGAGEHRVVFEFGAFAVLVGAGLSFLSALVAGSLIWPRHRRPSLEHAPGTSTSTIDLESAAE